MQYFVISRTAKNDREKNLKVVLYNISIITTIYLISTTTTITRRMIMFISKNATIPIVVPIMMTRSVASLVFVLFTYTGGVATDSVGVIKSVVTITTTKRWYQLRIGEHAVNNTGIK